MKNRYVILILLTAVMLVFGVSCSAANPKAETSAGESSETPSEPTKPSEPVTPVTPAVEPKAVGTLEELKDALKNGGSYYLTADITIVGSVNIFKPVTLDGKGKTISVDFVTSCGACGGSGKQPCDICQGSGFHTCELCDGTGDDPDEEDCPNCHGLGFTECPTSGTESCSECNATGKKAKDDADTGLVIRSKGVTIKNVKFKSTSAGAEYNAHIIVTADGTEAEPIVIEDCSFDSGKSLSDDFKECAIVSCYDRGDYLAVKNCTIKNMNYGMYFRQISNGEICGNTIDGTRYNGICIEADLKKCPSDNVKVVNNTLTGISYANADDESESCGIYFGKYCSDITVSGNSITMLNSKKDIVKSYENN